MVALPSFSASPRSQTWLPMSARRSFVHGDATGAEYIVDYRLYPDLSSYTVPVSRADVLKARAEASARGTRLVSKGPVESRWFL